VAVKVAIDTKALSEACARFGVARLRVFGSVLNDHFDPQASDIDFLVDFQAGREDRFADFFGLQDELTRIFGRKIDLIVAESVKNPYFKSSVLRMSMRPESYAHVWDALQAVRALRRFTQGVSEEEYLSDLMLSSAVERQFEILCEALNRVRRSDPQTADKIPDIHRIIGMRNIIAHEYGSVDGRLVWAAATTHAVALETVLSRFLQDAQRPE